MTGRRRLLNFFEDLKDFEITSRETPDYNCLAWVFGDTKRWWGTLDISGYFWPEDVPREWTIQAAEVILRNRGYEDAFSTEWEPGFEKIAVYSSGTELTHFAKQLPTGEWTSKIAGLEDIRHTTAECLEGRIHGKITRIFKKAI